MKTWQWVLIGVGVLAMIGGVYWAFFKEEDEPLAVGGGGSNASGSKSGGSGSVASADVFAKKGMKGQAVKDVQNFINSLGYTPQLKPDGDFGSNTEKAVYSVFSKNHVTQTDWGNRYTIGTAWKKVGTYVTSTNPATGGTPIKGGVLDVIYGQKQ